MEPNKLKAKIVEMGFSQTSLAPKVGMSKNTLNAKVNGRIPFNTDEIMRMCTVLNIVDNVEKSVIFLGGSSQKWDSTAQ